VAPHRHCALWQPLAGESQVKGPGRVFERHRAGVEGTIRQAVTDMHRARSRGLAKTHLEHVCSAVALNLLQLHAWGNGRVLDRTRTTHLARLELSLAA
jgi:hypothetical protein